MVKVFTQLLLVAHQRAPSCLPALSKDRGNEDWRNMNTFVRQIQALRKHHKILKRTTAEIISRGCTLDMHTLHAKAEGTHLPAFSSGLTKEVVNHVKLLLFHHNKTLLFGIFPIYFWWPLNKKCVQVIHPVKRRGGDNHCLVVHEPNTVM